MKKVKKTINSCKDCPYKHGMLNYHYKEWFCNLGGFYVGASVAKDIINANCPLEDYE